VRGRVIKKEMGESERVREKERERESEQEQEGERGGEKSSQRGLWNVNRVRLNNCKTKFSLTISIHRGRENYIDLVFLLYYYFLFHFPAKYVTRC